MATQVGIRSEQHIYSKRLDDGGHVRWIEVDRTPAAGWRVLEQRDDAIVKDVTYEDWHRVELAIRRFTAQSLDPGAAGD